MTPTHLRNWERGPKLESLDCAQESELNRLELDVTSCANVDRVSLDCAGRQLGLVPHKLRLRIQTWVGLYTMCCSKLTLDAVPFHRVRNNYLSHYTNRLVYNAAVPRVPWRRQSRTAGRTPRSGAVN
jgi:hypothetical protein